MATGSFHDPTEGWLATLSEPTRSRARVMVWAVRSAGVPLIITSGRRTTTEQRALVAAGRSRTMASAHLSGQAFDIDIAGVSRSSIPSWFWSVLGPWAERQLGLTWGGRWRSPYDPGHFES